MNIKATIDFKRQSLIFDPSNFSDKVVAIVGLGNIGSHTALALARLGIQNLMIYDFDKIETHNLSSQAFDSAHLGMEKTVAVGTSVQRINPDCAVINVNEKFDPRKQSPHSEIVVIAVDSMRERKRISEMYRTAHWPQLLIDARIGGNQLEVYNIRTWDEWQETFSDKPSTDPCGGRYISYVSLMVAGVIANQVKKFFKGEKMDQNIVMDANTLQVVKNVSWK